MAWIALEGMRFHAFHGVYEAEKKLGGEYIVDVYVNTGIVKSAESDKLADTYINYETVFQICLVEMAKPRNLLETVVTGIVHEIKRQFGFMKGIRVRVKKLNPPIYGRMRGKENFQAIVGQAETAWVEDEGNFVTKCPRCKEDFICYKDDTCWCKALTNLHAATIESLNRQFGTSCLCGNCLKLYLG